MRSIAIGMAALVLVAGSACGPSGGGRDRAGPQEERTNSAPAGGSGSEVTVQMFRYQPEELTVAVGTEVTWTNRDEILHTATSGSPGEPTDVFDGEMASQGETFASTFDREGRYAYFCSRHNGMRGTIVVEG